MSREEAIVAVTRRLVELYNPVRIYLFGSAARGDSGPHSDLDFMVLLPDSADRSRLRASEFYRAKRAIRFPVDILLWRESDFDGRLHLKASFPSTILREGKLLYDARN